MVVKTRTIFVPNVDEGNFRKSHRDGDCVRDLTDRRAVESCSLTGNQIRVIFRRIGSHRDLRSSGLRPRSRNVKGDAKKGRSAAGARRSRWETAPPMGCRENAVRGAPLVGRAR
jgi:hypothetical protein